MVRLLVAVVAALALWIVLSGPRKQDSPPPAQTSACIACGLVITERERVPCPRCGSINRVVYVSVGDRVGIQDKV